MARYTRNLSRSEFVRQRRNKRKKNNILANLFSRTSREARRKSPPMLTRSTMSPKVQRIRSRSRTRQRKYLPLSITGAELKLPALPVIKLGARVISGSLIVLLAITIYAFLSLPQFRVKSVEVKGVERLSGFEINTVLGVSSRSIFTLDKFILLDILEEKFPELSNSAVSIGFPARVTVKIAERIPLLAWEQSGVTVWIDEQGVGFLPRGDVDGLVLVQAKDIPGEDQTGDQLDPSLISPEMVSAVLDLSKQAPVDTILMFDLENGFGWVDPDGWEVYFGTSPKDIPARLSVYSTIVASLKEKNIKPALISVEHLHAPFYRLRR